MKKITLSALALLFAIGLSAQTHFGIKGGLNFDNMKIKNIPDVSVKNATGWHAGVAMQAKLALGFVFQPELLYSVKSIGLNGLSSKNSTVNFNYIELPLNLQWGVDLIILRPFVMASPYLSYLLGTNGKPQEWSGVKNIDYGFGAGFGVDIWKLQVTGKWNWGFGKLGEIKHNDISVNANNLKGFQLSLGLLF